MKEIGIPLETLLGDFKNLSARIRNLDFQDGAKSKNVTVRASYISFRDGLPTHDDFINTIYELIIPFCIPRSEIAKTTEAMEQDGLKSVASLGKMVQLSKKAATLFIKAKKDSHRSGEAGEILLYTFNEWLLEAPQIVSKMYLKTNSNMPVHGTDGIHAKYDKISQSLILYWGESKAHKTLSSALSSALESILEFVTNQKEEDEIRIVSQYMDLGSIHDDFKEEILSYIDPYNEKSNQRVSVFPCLLIFEHDYLKGKDYTHDQIDKEFQNEISKIVSIFCEGIQENLKSKSLETRRFEFFLFPVPSVEEFRNKFQEKIGWPND